MVTAVHKLQGAGGVSGGAGSYWIALAGTSGDDDGQAVAVDSNNNIFSVGMTSQDTLVIKYDPSGTIMWKRQLGTSVFDGIYSCAVDSNDSIIITGYTEHYDAGNITVTKYDADGNLQFARVYGGSDFEFGTSVCIDTSDNIIVSGRTRSYGQGSSDCFLMKLNSYGSLQWFKTLGKVSQNEEFWGPTTDASGNIYVTGFSPVGFGSYDQLLVKYNSSGTLQWQRGLGGAGSDQGRQVLINGSGDIYVSGNADGTGFLLSKYNSSGTLLWYKVTTPVLSGNMPGFGSAIDSLGNIYIAGYFYNNYVQYDMAIVKYDSSGSVVWAKTLGGGSNDFLSNSCIEIDQNDNIIVAGDTASDGAGSIDFLTAKLPSDGSGNGTYGSLVYQDLSVTTTSTGLSSTTSSLISGSYTPATNGVTFPFTPTDPTLTEELLPITI